MSKDQYVTKHEEILEILESLDGYACVFGTYNAGRSKAVIDLDPPDEDEENSNFYELHLIGVFELHLYNHAWVARSLTVAIDERGKNLYRLVQCSGDSTVIDVNFSDFALKRLNIE